MNKMDPRRKERIRECPDNPGDGLPTGEQFNALGMVLSLVALLMKVRFISVCFFHSGLSRERGDGIGSRVLQALLQGYYSFHV